jgi:hypothetical protein
MFAQGDVSEKENTFEWSFVKRNTGHFELTRTKIEFA